MTVNWKLKQAAHEYAQAHDVSYAEALRRLQEAAKENQK